MKLFRTLIQSVGILLAGFAVIALVNLPHDRLINAVAAGTAKNHLPFGARAECLSLGITFLAGVLASTVVGLLSERLRKPLLVVLMALFLLADLSAAFGVLAGNSLLYRSLVVLLVPLEIGAGYLLSKQLRPAKQRLAGQSNG